MPCKHIRSQIQCIETGEVYESAAAVCRILGCGRSAMANHLAGRFPSIRGLHFKRVE